GHAVAYTLCGFRRHRGANRRANLLQRAARGFGDRSEVLVHGFRNGFLFLHGGNTTKVERVSPVRQIKKRCAYGAGEREDAGTIPTGVGTGVSCHYAFGWNCQRQISFPSGSSNEPSTPVPLSTAAPVRTPLARKSFSADSTFSTRRQRRPLPEASGLPLTGVGTSSNRTPSISKRATTSREMSLNPRTSR